MYFYFVISAVATLLAVCACEARRRRAALTVGDAAMAQKRRGLSAWYWGLAVGSALPYFLVSAFRDGVGTDYYGMYQPTFLSVAKGLPIFDGAIEPGYWLLNRCILLFTQDYHVLFVLTSAMIVGLFVWGSYMLSDIPWVSVLLFMWARHFFISMNGVRQYMALAIVFCAFAFIRERCLWKYALCVLAASLFHTSALIFLPLYFLSYVPLTPFVGAGVVAGLCALRAPMIALLRFVVSKTGYSWYLDSAMESAVQYYPEKMWLNFLLFCLGGLYYGRQENAKKPLYQFCMNVELLLLFFTLNRDIVPLTDRLCWSLEITQLLWIPMIAVSEKRRWLRWLLLALMVGAYAVFTYMEIRLWGHHEVVPYRCIIFPERVFW